MKNFNFNRIRDQVLDFNSDCLDHKVPLNRINFDSASGQPSLDVNNDRLFFNDPFPLNQVATRLSIPTNYFAKCPPYLQRINFTYWKEKQLQRNPEAFWFIRMRKNKVRAVLGEKFVKFDNIDLLRMMKVFIGNKNVQMIYVNLDKHTFSLRIVFLKWGQSKNDIFPGVSLINSEVGAVPFEARLFVYTKVCDNGMLSSQHIDSIQKRGYKEDDEMWKYKFGEFLKGSYKRGTGLATKLIRAKLVTVDSPKDFLMKKFVNKFTMPQTFKSHLLETFERSKPKTLYDLINTITLAAQSCDIVERSRYEELAGSFALDYVSK